MSFSFVNEEIPLGACTLATKDFICSLTTFKNMYFQTVKIANQKLKNTEENARKALKQTKIDAFNKLSSIRKNIEESLLTLNLTDEEFKQLEEKLHIAEINFHNECNEAIRIYNLSIDYAEEEADEEIELAYDTYQESKRLLELTIQ